MQSEKIRQEFERVRTSSSDVWFVREDGKILSALVSGDRAWLMYQLDDSDSGFSSRNPDYTGPKDAVLPYTLGNGQLDEYPVAWTIALDDAIRVVEYFLQTGEKAAWITWHCDYFPVERYRYRKSRKALDVLASDDRAWLTYRRKASDPGFTSRDPDYAGPGDARYEFVLQSGQRVTYPAAWTIARQEASRAVDYFQRTGEKAPWIVWHDNTD